MRGTAEQGASRAMSAPAYRSECFHEHKRHIMELQVLGLLREQLISSYLGLTGLADAFNLASTFPVLCLTGIGGLNGALHSATASTAAQLPQSNDKGRCAHSCHCVGCNYNT